MPLVKKAKIAVQMPRHAWRTTTKNRLGEPSRFF
jgi:hypothetical protein